MSRWVVGIDEVGRGPLAGPVVVAGGAGWGAGGLGPGTGRIRDSKQLSSRQRQIIYTLITSNSAFCWAVVSVGPRIIDRIGIQVAAELAAAKAFLRLAIPSRLVLLDGSLYLPNEYRQCTIIKCDEQIPLIAAASILAKVTRDRFMERQHARFPEYGFAAHKGYGTKVHYAALRRHGPCFLHRKSFL